MPEVLAMIPARLGSKRLPRKMLLEVNHKPVICHTVDRVLDCVDVGRVVLCTDSPEIADTVHEWFEAEDRVDVKYHTFNAETGCDRTSLTLAFWPELMEGMSKECILHIHGDEVNVNPNALSKLIAYHLSHIPHYPMTQLVGRTYDRDLKSTNSCKVQTDWGGEIQGYSRTEDGFYTAMGVFAFDPVALLAFHRFIMGPKEIKTGIEQYRLIDQGVSIRALDARLGDVKSAIDTEDDLKRFENLMREGW